MISIGMILANRRLRLGLDELQQKIQLNAMGLSLGVGFIVGLSDSNLDITNLITGHADISHFTFGHHHGVSLSCRDNLRSQEVSMKNRLKVLRAEQSLTQA
jgi:hypothetical protein